MKFKVLTTKGEFSLYESVTAEQLHNTLNIDSLKFVMVQDSKGKIGLVNVAQIVALIQEN